MIHAHSSKFIANDLTLEGISPEIAHRLPGFIGFGIDGNKLVKALKKAGVPQSDAWSQIFLEYGHEAAHHAEIAEKTLNSALAERSWLEASFGYFLARFPHMINPASQKAYQLHNEAYLNAIKYSPYTIETMTISIEGKKGNALLRFPKINQTTYPVVIIAGGIDTWKSELEVHYLSNTLLAQGIATLQIDIPGTGECPIPASVDAHIWFEMALKELKNHPKINGSKIAFYGLSFGGYWATKMAFIAPWLCAVINTGGPIHHTFETQWLQKLPPGLKKILPLTLHLDKNTEFNTLMDKLNAFSLLNQNLLSSPKTAPMLNINGAKDNVVSIREISFLEKHHIKQDSLIFSEDRHVASQNWLLHNPFSVQWLLKKFRIYTAAHN